MKEENYIETMDAMGAVLAENEECTKDGCMGEFCVQEVRIATDDANFLDWIYGAIIKAPQKKFKYGLDDADYGVELDSLMNQLLKKYIDIDPTFYTSQATGYIYRDLTEIHDGILYIFVSYPGSEAADWNPFECLKNLSNTPTDLVMRFMSSYYDYEHGEFSAITDDRAKILFPETYLYNTGHNGIEVLTAETDRELFAAFSCDYHIDDIHDFDELKQAIREIRESDDCHCRPHDVFYHKILTL